MFSYSGSRQIDERTIKLTVGMIAILLAPLAYILTCGQITSISASYANVDHPSARDIFVGFLYAIAALMASYNGTSRWQKIFTKVAALAAVGIAMFPCCGPTKHPIIHYSCAAAMFLVLAYLCYAFYREAVAVGHREALYRSKVYAFCLVSILTAIAIMGLDAIFAKLGVSVLEGWTDLTLCCESLGLFAFGMSWLMASHVLPLFTNEAERHHPLR